MVCSWVLGVVVNFIFLTPSQGQGVGFEDQVFRWVGSGETGRRVRVWGKSSNFPDSSGVNHSFALFSAIPFALPPTAHLRFQRPTLRILDKDFRATTPPPPCPQLDGSGAVIGEEDCLYLNIYLPFLPRGRDKLMPVLIWLHGEAPEILRRGVLEPFSSGWAGQVNPGVFLPGGVVIVVPQFRLGTLGYSSTVNEDLTGNQSLFDSLLALEWVQRFILHFSGDKDQVTLLGGSAAGLLATTDLAKGHFHRLILMGGFPTSPLSLDTNPKVTYGEVALQNNCPSFPSSHFVRCMQGRRVSSVVYADQRLLKGRGLARRRGPLPLVQKESDGRFLPPLLFRTPRSTLIAGESVGFTPVPLIIGVTAQEMRGFLPGLVGAESVSEVAVLSSEVVLEGFLRSVLSRYSTPFQGDPLNSEAASKLLTFEYFSGLNLTQKREQAWDLLEEMMGDFLFNVPALSTAQLWSKHAPVYFYLFDHGENVNHGSDVEFLMRGQAPGSSGSDVELSSIMVSLWTSFIHQGTPLNAPGIKWPEWREATGSQLLLLSGEELGVDQGLRQRQFTLWTNILSSLTPAASKCTNKSALLTQGGRRNLKLMPPPPLLYKDVDEGEASKRFYILDKLE